VIHVNADLDSEGGEFLLNGQISFLVDGLSRVPITPSSRRLFTICLSRIA